MDVVRIALFSLVYVLAMPDMTWLGTQRPVISTTAIQAMEDAIRHALSLVPALVPPDTISMPTPLAAT